MLSEIEKNPESNLLDFLDGNITETSDAPPAFDVNMVNLMTIHKAKGLEFKHVFLTFFDKKYIFKSEKNLIVDDDLKKWTIPVKVDEVSKDSILAKKVLAQQANIAKSEIDRMLYVALTRAVDSVHVFVNKEELDKSNSYWKKKFDWDFSLGLHTLEDYSYEVRLAKISEKTLFSNF